MRRMAPLGVAVLLGLVGAVVLLGGRGDDDLAAPSEPFATRSGRSPPGQGAPPSRGAPAHPEVDGRPGVPRDEAILPADPATAGGEAGTTPSRRGHPDPTDPDLHDAPPAPADLAQEFDTPDAAGRASWMEERVNAFLDRVDPDDERPLARSCTPDGASCTFEGPVADDFARKLVKEATGVRQEDLLEGITFSELRFEVRDGVKHVVLTTQHPDGSAAPR